MTGGISCCSRCFNPVYPVEMYEENQGKLHHRDCSNIYGVMGRMLENPIIKSSLLCASSSMRVVEYGRDYQATNDPQRKKILAVKIGLEVMNISLIMLPIAAASVADPNFKEKCDQACELMKSFQSDREKLPKVDEKF